MSWGGIGLVSFRRLLGRRYRDSSVFDRSRQFQESIDGSSTRSSTALPFRLFAEFAELLETGAARAEVIEPAADIGECQPTKSDASENCRIRAPDAVRIGKSLREAVRQQIQQTLLLLLIEMFKVTQLLSPSLVMAILSQPGFAQSVTEVEGCSTRAQRSALRGERVSAPAKNDAIVAGLGRSQ